MHFQLNFALASERGARLLRAAEGGTTFPTPSAMSSSGKPVKVPVTKISGQSPGCVLSQHDHDRLKINDWTVSPQGAGGSDTVAEAITTCLQNELAASTLTAYQAALWREVPASEQSAGYRLLPMDSEHKFLQMYGGMLARYGQDLHWTKVRTVRAAILKWHERNGFSEVMVEWTP